MSAIDTTRLSARPAQLGFFAKLSLSFAAWNDARVTRNALAKLSDRELADIGLTRYDAQTIGN